MKNLIIKISAALVFSIFLSAPVLQPLQAQEATPEPAKEADRVGVGVGTGKIIIDDTLKPGARYELTPLSVINTGNVPAEYEVSITYHEQQKEMRPDLSWFAFTPNNFVLNPGEVKVVNISLLLPLKTEPGDYFAYLEAHPIRSVKDGSTSIGVAAAAKLYFKVQPSNVLGAMYYRGRSLYQDNTVLFNIIGGTVLVFALITLFRKFVSFDIKLKPKSSKEDAEEPKHHS